MNIRTNNKNFYFIFTTFTLYTFVSIFTKEASFHPFLSELYVLWFSCEIIVLGIYAIMWQKLLSIMPLNKAYMYKSSSIFTVLIISHYLYGESITISNILGTILILTGLIVLSWKE